MNTSNNTHAQKKPGLMVLGPHRSGTSLLSGILHHLGGDLPKTLMNRSSDNPKGYFESTRIMEFNDKLLAAIGSDWQDIAPLDASWPGSPIYENFFQDAVTLLRSEFAEARLPLLKDPRNCRLVQFWSDAFCEVGYRVAYVHTHRNPFEVAESLNKRDGIPVEQALLIWLRHVLDAEASTRGASRFFTNYASQMDNWREQSVLAEKTLGVGLDRNTRQVEHQIDEFIESKLWHQKLETVDLRGLPQASQWVCDTYEILERWTGGAGTEADFHKLDAIKCEFDASINQIIPLIRALKHSHADLEANAMEAQRISEENQRLTIDLSAAHKNTATAVAQLNTAVAENRIALHQRSLELEEQLSENIKLTRLIDNLRENDLRVQKAHQDELTSLNESSTQMEQQHEQELQQVQTSMRAGFAERDAEIRGLKHDMKERFSEIANLSKIVLEVQSQKDLEIEEILSSTSWKITAPIRRIVGLFRKPH